LYMPKDMADADERATDPSLTGRGAAENAKAVSDDRVCPAASKSIEARSVLKLFAIKPLKTVSSHPDAGLSPWRMPV